jgi:predicted Rossmann fold flavoprotein
MKYDVVIVGGGAAGFFTAVNIAEKNYDLKICILEKSTKVLSKVKISGGGRCNFTHACYIPKELSKFYPRGQKELLGPFHTFASGDTIEWFESKGVDFYTTDDGSIFPKSDDSQTIIDTFLNLSKKYGIDIYTSQEVVDVKAGDNWTTRTKNKIFNSDKLIITTGSSKDIWNILSGLGHDIIEPVPSLFTFKIKDKRIDGLMGVVVEKAAVSLKGSKLPEQTGPLLITHWGMSGPAVLKMSSFGAREMFAKSYQNTAVVNWLPEHSFDSISDAIADLRGESPKKQVLKHNPFFLPTRLWKSLVSYCSISDKHNWADLNKKQILQLATELTQGEYAVNGRTKFKEEFVTAGGVNLKEIDFKRFESKLHKNLFIAGEALDIDAVTGGFNFQNAWTGGWIISEAITK